MSIKKELQQIIKASLEKNAIEFANNQNKKLLKQGNLLLSAPKVENGKISLDPVAQAHGWKSEKERSNFQATHPNEYAVMGGFKYNPVPSKNATLLDEVGKKRLTLAQQQDEYFQKYGVLDFSNNYNIDADSLQGEIDTLNSDCEKVKNLLPVGLYEYDFSDTDVNENVGKKTVSVENNKKGKYIQARDILNKYGCKTVSELEALLASKKRSIEFWKRSNDLVEMTAVGDHNSNNYDPEFKTWYNIGKKI